MRRVVKEIEEEYEAGGCAIWSMLRSCSDQLDIYGNGGPASLSEIGP
jgi:hypothetical protein